jgi:6-phosphogluconolactonase
MKTQVFADVNAVANAAAKFIASEARAAVNTRGRFLLAVSGGKTPCRMLQDLAEEDIPWKFLHVFQVDERVAPSGHADRNLTHLWESLILRSPIPPDQIHIMPVEDQDLGVAAANYNRTIQKIAGMPAVLDLVHLGLGSDGHTASLVPNDPVLDVTDTDVAITRIYQSRRRMTLTYPLLNRSRRVLWVVTGPDKTEMLARLSKGDVSIPAGRIRRDHALLFTEQTIAGKLSIT